MSGFGPGPIFEYDDETDSLKPGRDHVMRLVKNNKLKTENKTPHGQRLATARPQADESNPTKKQDSI